jgi:hypothetical protein
MPRKAGDVKGRPSDWPRRRERGVASRHQTSSGSPDRPRHRCIQANDMKPTLIPRSSTILLAVAPVFGFLMLLTWARPAARDSQG